MPNTSSAVETFFEFRLKLSEIDLYHAIPTGVIRAKMQSACSFSQPLFRKPQSLLCVSWAYWHCSKVGWPPWGLAQPRLADCDDDNWILRPPPGFSQPCLNGGNDEDTDRQQGNLRGVQLSPSLIGATMTSMVASSWCFTATVRMMRAPSCLS